MYLNDNDELILPSLNVLSFLSAIGTDSAPKRLYDPKRASTVCKACCSYVQIPQMEIPFVRDGKPIVFNGFDQDGWDRTANIEVMKHVAKVKKGQLSVPNPKERPCLHLDWCLEFNIRLISNKIVSEDQLKHIFIEGGLAVGLGTYRGVFGKFAVDTWE
jgi:hypothetical protein